MINRSKSQDFRKKSEIGWRENVGLPDFGITALRAKIDTGARTTALHAVDLEVFENDSVPWIKFRVPIKGERKSNRCEARIIDQRLIKNTSGVPQMRYVIQTTLVLGNRHWNIEVSLADRENMGFDMIIGRTAIRGRHMVVDPGRSYIMGPPRKPKVSALHSTENGLLKPRLEGKRKKTPSTAKGERQ